METPPAAGADPASVNALNNYRTRELEQTEEQVAAFAKLGEFTGGRAFDPPELDAATARDVIQFLANQVRYQYVVGFAPESSSTPRPHKIEVRLVGHKDAKLDGGSRIVVH